MSHKNYGLIILSIVLLLTTSCKKEFTTIGNQLIEQPDFQGKIYDQSKVTTYDQPVDKVFSATLSLPEGINALGIYNDPVFGTLKAAVAAPVNSDATKFTDDGFGDNVKIVDARMIVPYISHTNSDKTYELDSVYGTKPFEISVKELTYLLPTLDPDTNLIDNRIYYSDFDFSPFQAGQIADTIGFTPSNESFYEYERNTDGTFNLDSNGHKQIKDSLSPRLSIKLDTTFFRHKIFDHSGEEILTNAIRFKDYFRGLYIDALPQNNDGRYMMMDFAKAYILLSYTHDVTDDNGTPSDTSDDTVETVYEEINLKFTAPKTNIYQNTFSADMQTAINNSDMINGDDKVYVKGNAGAETIVQLFDTQQLAELRAKDWMINQAELNFYVDKQAVSNTLLQAPRLILYDNDQQKLLADLDALENIETGAYFDGFLKEDDNENPYYSFKITRHIRNVLKNDSMNVKLALRVSNNPKALLQYNDHFLDPDSQNPSGTILYGNQTTTADLKPILKIYYTDPK